MKTYIYTFLTVFVAALVAIFVSGLVGIQSVSFGASGTRFPNGISADSTSPSAGQVRGTTLTITSTANVSGVATLSGGTTLSGANTVSGTSTFSGTNTFSGNTKVQQASTSTLYIGGADYTGCLAMGDSSAPTSTNVVYITVTGATVSATTTKPSICR